MKKIGKLLLLTILLLGLTGCFSKGKSYHELSYDEEMQKMEQKETFVLYIGSSNCSACEKFKPTLEQVITEYDLMVYYIDVAKLTDEQANKFVTVINFGNATPKVYFIEEGDYSQYKAIRGAEDYETVVTKFQQSGYIEK